MSWQSCKATAGPGPTGAGGFLRWDNAPFRLAPAGEPEERHKHFKDNRYLGFCTADNGGVCEHCAAGVEVDTSYDWPVTLYPAGTPGTLTLSTRGIRTLIGVREKLGDQFDGTVFLVDRKGVGKKIQYVFSPVGREENEENAQTSVPF